MTKTSKFSVTQHPFVTSILQFVGFCIMTILYWENIDRLLVVLSSGGSLFLFYFLIAGGNIGINIWLYLKTKRKLLLLPGLVELFLLSSLNLIYFFGYLASGI